MKFSLVNPPYGYDAPDFILKFSLYGMITLFVTIILYFLIPINLISLIFIGFMLITTFFLLYPVIAILMGSLYFKFRERDWLFSYTSFKGHENILDVGCGRGLLLVKAAKQLTTGKAHGLDLWVQADQWKNSKEKTLENAKTEGVIEKIQIHTGDMQALPFPDNSMDVIVSSWAIHNLYKRNERENTLAEMLRVLKPDGRIAILDIDHAPSYKDYLIKNGLQEVQLLGPRYTFGNKTYLVLAKK